ncbi:MAG: hypothetical protein Q9195_007828 [Heterodermia aff. obscurata]
MSLCHSSALGAAARWICHDCTSKLQLNRIPKDRNFSASALLQSRLVRRKPRTEAVFPTFQRRRQSEQSTDRVNNLRDDLPSRKEGRRSDVAKKFSHLMDHLQSNIFIAGQRLNDLTGYSGIEALKKDIESQEKHVQSTRTALQAAREAYSTAISQRSSSQRKVNELLQRKHNWSPQDLEQFTALYRSDHAIEQTESVAQENLVKIERKSEEAAAKLSASILARYHEEQIWSDKIRRMSTWGTWGLMGVNVLLFLVFQIGVEPWRRKRLVKGFEDKVMEALEREGAGNVHDQQFAHSPHTSTNSSTGPLPISEEESATQKSKEEPVMPILEEDSVIQKSDSHTALVLSDSRPSENLFVEVAAGDSISQDAKVSKYRFERFSMAIQDLFSTRQIILRRIDVTALVLEAAAAGLVVATGVFMLLKPGWG